MAFIGTGRSKAPPANAYPKADIQANLQATAAEARSYQADPEATKAHCKAKAQTYNSQVYLLSHNFTKSCWKIRIKTQSIISFVRFDRPMYPRYFLKNKSKTQRILFQTSN